MTNGNAKERVRVHCSNPHTFQSHALLETLHTEPGSGSNAFRPTLSQDTVRKSSFDEQTFYMTVMCVNHDLALSTCRYNRYMNVFVRDGYLLSS